MAPFPSAVGLLATQIRHRFTQLMRIPVVLFFTIGLPLIMLVMFNALFGANEVDVGGSTMRVGQLYVGALAAFTVVSATFTNLVNIVPYHRQDGIMKRWRGTPLPRWVYLGGYIGSALAVAFVAMVLMVTVGIIAYGTELDLAKVPALVVSFAVGVAAFSVLGIAVAGLTRNPEAAPAVSNAIVLPLAFISDVFIVDASRPAWLETLGNAFPLKPFVNSVQAAFSPATEAPAFEWGDLAVVATWGVVGAVIAARTFKWEPFADVSRRRRSRRGAPAND